MIHVTILNYGQLVADLPEWGGPIPHVGDALFSPPSQAGRPERVAGVVKSVVWRMYDRRDPDLGPGVMTTHPYVEVNISNQP